MPISKFSFFKIKLPIITEKRLFSVLETQLILCKPYSVNATLAVKLFDEANGCVKEHFNGFIRIDGQVVSVHTV